MFALHGIVTLVLALQWSLPIGPVQKIRRGGALFFDTGYSSTIADSWSPMRLYFRSRLVGCAGHHPPHSWTRGAGLCVRFFIMSVRTCSTRLAVAMVCAIKRGCFVTTRYRGAGTAPLALCEEHVRFFLAALGEATDISRYTY